MAAFCGIQSDPTALMPSEEEMWGLAPARNYRNLHLLVREGAGVFFDDTSPFWDYDFAEFLPLNFTPGDSIKGIDANTIERYHYLTPDELTWAQVRYTRGVDGKWKPSSAVAYGREAKSDFGAFLKFAAPIFLIAIPGVGQAIGATAFSAAGVAVSPAVATAVGNLAVSTALNGGDIKSAIVGQLASFGGSAAGGFVGRAVDSAAIGSAVAAATSAAATGGDLKQAVLSSLAQSGVKAMENFDFGTFNFDLTQAPADAAPDWLAPPGDGGLIYDPAALGPYDGGQAPSGWSITTEQAIADYQANAGLWQPDPMLENNFQGDPFFYDDPTFPVSSPENEFGSVNTYGTGLEDVTVPVYTDTPAINSPPTTPVNQNQTSGDWLGSFVTGVTALAAAAMKLIPTIQALKNSDVIRSGTTTGSGNVVTANNNGTITQRNTSTGAVSTSIPPVGTAYQTPDGNIITNNGNGTYTVVRPDGSRYTGNYSSNSTGGVLTGGAASSDKTLIYVGVGLAALLLLKGK